MLCQNCAYPLINLTEPRCPECGEGFDPRDFRYPPGSVAFACPDCGKQHDGEGPQSHPPADGDVMTCRGCGRDVEVRLLRIVPLMGELHAEPMHLTPWDQWCRRSESWWSLLRSKGWGPAYRTPMRYWSQTWQMSLLNPGQLGDAIGRRSSWRNAMRFVADMYLVAITLLMLVSVGCFLMVALTMWLTDSAAALDVVGPIIGYFGAVSILPAYTALLMPLLVHPVLAVTGPLRGGFRLSAVAIAYAQGPAVIAAMPVIGLPLAIVWVLVSMIILLSRAQHVSLPRAAVAVLWAPLLMFLVPTAMLFVKIIAR